MHPNDATHPSPPMAAGQYAHRPTERWVRVVEIWRTVPLHVIPSASGWSSVGFHLSIGFICSEVAERYSDSSHTSSVKKKQETIVRISYGAHFHQIQRPSSDYGEDTMGGMIRETPRDGINSVS